MKKLTLLGALLCATAMQAQTTYYWPGTRVDALTSGQQYFIYNTANDGQDRSWFLFSNGSALRTNNTSPLSLLTTENKYIFTLTKPDDPKSQNEWNVKSVDGYVGIAGVTNNQTSPRNLYITPWSGNITKGTAKSEDENGNLQNPDEVNTHVFAITKNEGANLDPNDKTYAWNGTETKGAAGEGDLWTRWTAAHPYAFYTVESRTTDPAAYAYSLELTAQNGKLAELAFDMQKFYGLVQDGSKYYSNYKSSYEGSYEALLDGNDATYFHSTYTYGTDNAGTDADPKHYLRAELPEATSSFYFITKRRMDNNNNRPTSILIEGSNDDVVYTPIKTISEGFPTAADDYFYFSDKITSETAYKYIRFTPQTTSPSQTRFFTYSEFYVIDGTKTEVDDAMSAVKKLYTQKGITIKDEAFDESAFLAAGKAIDDELEKFNFKKAGNEAQELLQANENNHADDPKLGQYPTTAYNTFKEAVSTSQSSDELSAAIKAFKFSINAPVFTINGAFDGGYKTVGKSIYYKDGDASTPLWWNKETNKYDKTMLWKFAGLTSQTPEIGATYSLMNLSADVYLWGVENVTIENTNPTNTDGIVLLKTEGYPNPIHADQSGSIVRWNNLTPNSASAWTLEYVGESKNIEKILNSGQLDAYAELQALVSACEPFKDKIGTGLNQFASDDLNPALEAAKAVIAQDIYENPDLNVTEVRDRLKAAKEALTINQPEPGFYRIKNASNGKYVCSTPVADGRQSLVDNADDKTTVFYLSADNRLTNSIGVNLNKDTHPDGNNLGTTFEFLINNNGYYMIKSTERTEPLYPHYDGGDLLSYDFNGGNYADKLVDAWTLESVTKTADQPAITKEMAADYATIAAPVALNVPAGVTAYTVKVEGEVAKLTELGNVIPAGVAAVIKGTAGATYEFTFASEGSTTNKNDLQGVYVSTTISPETVAYVLASGTQGVGFYLLDATDRTLAANKAYLELPADAANVKAFILNTGDLTGIESVATGAEAEEYYDLQGRRVMKPTKGIYVTKSGKKVIF